VNPEIESVEKAGAPDIEAELAIRHGGKIPPPVGDEERLVVLEDELRQVRREGRRKDVVVIADGNGVSGMWLPHAERA
jgi:hypothetical protein